MVWIWCNDYLIISYILARKDFFPRFLITILKKASNIYIFMKSGKNGKKEKSGKNHLTIILLQYGFCQGFVFTVLRKSEISFNILESFHIRQNLPHISPELWVAISIAKKTLWKLVIFFVISQRWKCRYIFYGWYFYHTIFTKTNFPMFHLFFLNWNFPPKNI